MGLEGALTYVPLLLRRRVILLAPPWPYLHLQLEEQACAGGLEAAEASPLSTREEDTELEA